MRELKVESALARALLNALVFLVLVLSFGG
jgi:hypothetical protein